jgi:hypothetical protein
MFRLIDDGTLDTVLECSECGDTLRFDSGSLDPDNRVGEAHEIALAEHECECEEGDE